MGLVLASLSDKTGLVEFAKRLEKKGFDFIASGGTARTLKQERITVREVSEYTSSPEILGGRVKTLHPVIHGGILARNTDTDKNELKKLSVDEIDIVVVNLYPFEDTATNVLSTEEDCIENIDIGGVALLRAAAKNYARVTVICDSSDYDTVAKEIEQTGGTALETRKKLAYKAFALCTRYDAAITEWMQKALNLEIDDIDTYSESLMYNKGLSSKPQPASELRELRYGENPHQKAWYYPYTSTGKNNENTVLGGKVLQGKELSFNNILDADAAWRAVSLFDKPAAVVVKHLTPCGIAELGSEEQTLKTALEAAIACDPVSAYGSIIAVNRTFDKNCFEAIEKLFAECIIAPEFSEDVKSLLAKKKNLRLIEQPLSCSTDFYETKSVLGGVLMQERDAGDPASTEYKNAADREASEKETLLLKFAMKACTMVKSNAILLAAPIFPENIEQGICSVGIGCGQPNRVDAAKQAITRAGKKAQNAVLASDAFFPFADTIEAAAAVGISAVIQPGGSIHDDLSIAECNKHGMAMLITGVRHFKH